ncbi:RHS repeat-associated core domain-containing protein [Kitasatospora sp. NPDC056181]|uniref:RHS repeat-associated core domain-containing protein n=1 Tax=Kitasatospora sp. NPDC056181 TaxID=3345737 RepID=UPI0035E3A290
MTSTVLTPASGALPTQVQSTGPMGAGWTTTTTLDPARGSALTSTDPNGRVITGQYDALGRLTAVWTPDRPTNKLPSRQFTYTLRGSAGPSSVKTESLNDDAATYTVNIDLFDGLGRPRQSQRTSAAKPAGRLISDTIYDTHGWAIKTSSPYYEKSSFPSESIFVPQGDGQIPGQTWNTYDGNGRVVRAEFRSYGNLQWANTTAYPGADRTDTTPPSGGTPASAVTDARGRATALWQYRTPTATGNSSDADVTTYTYTPVDLPATHTDSSGNTWSSTYDLRGRQVSASDPDTGTTQTFYDVNSRIDHTVDATGNTLAYSYDLLGRKTATFSGNAAPANQLAGWTYDTLAKGQPTSSTRYVGGASGAGYTKAVTGYDTAYRPLGTSITIPPAEGALAGTYTTTNTYSPVLGALTETDITAAGGLPAESITYANTITGLLYASASLDQAIVAQVDYDALARPVRTTVGDYGTQVVSTQQYDWATGRIINSFLDRQIGTVSTDQTTYTYTPSGRITSATDIQDASATDTQCFTYDHLGRLTNAWTDTGGTFTTADWTDSSGIVHGTGSSTTVPGIGGCTNTSGPATVSPGGRTIGGPAPYWNTYSYNVTGNRTGLVQHDITGNSLNDTTTTQTFGAAKSRNTPTTAPNTGGGTGGPHALLSSTSRGPAGTKALGYQYDAAGNTTAITDTGGTTSLTWNGEGKLNSLARTGQAGATTYLYDADGNPLIRRNPGKTTLNLPSDELTLDTNSGSMSNVRSFSAPGGLTYTRVTAPIGGGTVLIQTADPHRTNGVQINTDADQTVTRRASDPFGNPRGNQPTGSAWAGTKGFVGGSKDDTTGLTNLGARQYDPGAGRFISPDPVLDTSNPQQWNGYAYSENDPVNFSDPSGLKSEECGTLYDCGSGGTITMSNAQETTAEYVPWAAQYRNYETIKDDRYSVSHQWIIAQINKNIKAPKPSFKYAAMGALQVTAELLGVDVKAGSDCAKNKAAGACVNFLTSLASAASGTKMATVPLRAALEAQSLNCRNSFPADTLVLMADGSGKPIGEIQPGDFVAAADPQTGETSGNPVTAKIVTPDDTRFTELTIATTSKIGTSSAATSLVSTSNHPYWDSTTHRWTDAENIEPGHELATDDSSTAVVIATHTYATQPQTAQNLTVAGLHTYYVIAGNSPILVHNAICAERGLGMADKAAEKFDYPGGMTGALYLEGGDKPLPLSSGGNNVIGGRDSYAWPPGANKVNYHHLEAQSAAIMREGNIQHAELFISGDYVCPTCRGSLEAMLPANSTLTVTWRKSGVINTEVFYGRN